MKKGVKVVTIGGGSSYTPELIEGLIKRQATLPVRELWLVDIEEGQEKLKIIAALAKRMVKKAKVPIEIHATLNRKEASPSSITAPLPASKPTRGDSGSDRRIG